MSASGVLKRSTILIHGSIGMPLAIIGYPLVVYLPPFYAQEVGLNMALMALVLVFARITDVVTDPLIGTLSDRWQTRAHVSGLDDGNLALWRLGSRVIQPLSPAQPGGCFA